MSRSEAEDELRARFGQSYVRNQRPVMKRIERAVCGCDYGATSWATREEVGAISAKLGLQPGTHLMDLGAGSGWPGLYLASLSGCNVALVDMPEEGLAIAAARARDDRLPGVHGIVADGSALPWADRSFDAITHLDVLCCLPDKQSVLAECRRTIRADGRMIFSVISIAPELSNKDHTRAVELGPPYGVVATDYDKLLRLTDWITVEQTDCTAQYLDNAKSFLAVDQANRSELADVLGEEDCQQRIDKDVDLIDAIGSGLLRRKLYEVRTS